MLNKQYMISVGLISTVVLVVGGLLCNSGTQEVSSNKIEILSEPWYYGQKSASVTIDMYPDFECSICVDKERMAVQAFVDFSDKIRLVYHHYADAGFSEKIAEGLEAAGEQGKFWEMHDRIIREVPADIAQLMTAAEEIDLNLEEFSDALESGRFTEKVQIAKKEAISAGVKHVSVFVNGKEYQKNPGTLDDFYAAIAEELEKTGANSGD